MPTKTGAPAQHSQSSRKGKKAWRKNVDIGAVEEHLESQREEERALGGPVHTKTNDQLFSIDTRGDEQVRKRIAKVSFKNLKSYQIISRRSAVPAVVSRKNNPASVSHVEKMRMLKVGRRKKPILDLDKQQVQVNQVQDAYEMWDGHGGIKEDPSTSKPSVKAPASLRPHTSLARTAVDLPHDGTSYNPSFESHQELLNIAHESELKRVADEEKWASVKKQMMDARNSQADVGGDGALGMQVSIAEEDEPSAEGDEQNTPQERGKLSKPKSKKQRRKAALLLVEKRQKAAQAARRKQLEVITSKTLRALKTRKEETQARKRPDLPIGEQGSIKRQKLGKHAVPAPRLDVQLGEELSESLRELQPEGNLIRDRFESMQQRALVEPRVPVLPRKNKLKVRDYEKHAWKRFS